MTRVAQLLDLMQRAWQGEAWHGPSLSELLQDVSAEQAYHKRDNTHSIWELTAHMAVWKEVALQRLSNVTVDPPQSEDWPEIPSNSERDWEKTKERLRRSHTALWEAVERLSDADLETAVPGRNHSAYVMLHGVIHHDLYHGGQIAILKKKPD